ncbi:hypothetical protein EMIHUDRAFT_234479 [Emiliania huxleyi CCMP1516]|uniref:Transmembrane protein n=2 Tax=Emiliania huxleyi TaxID=2903 RepID=A0A0D3JZ83_EMIH1|nr:hypothetical protein EMIHUDRAFT_234479 [Emiliania huxleyi CCMP1516]EOD28818.1 hypothetical protein EMIHUDRAFT_234479 [Emiliania huxleyi CCMP1516]|eukprot:XP_005781247.1 hypothetical protein EMIHUDRAFT_234479 [Emiliania huxleyi CCMP1516]
MYVLVAYWEKREKGSPPLIDAHGYGFAFTVGMEIMRQPSAAPNVVDAHIHQRPLARYDSVGLGGIHAWAFVKATAPGASLSAAIPLLLSILLMCGQSVVMYAVVYEAAHPRCSSHNHCAVGEYCHPKDFYIFGEPITRQPWRHEKAPGVCLDCYNMQLTAENISGVIMALDSRRHVLGPYVDIWSNSSFAIGAGWFGHSAAEDLSGEQWAREAAAHCDATDIMPLRCDHLVVRQSRLAATHYFVLVFVVMLILIPLAEDWDEAALEKRLLRHRTRARRVELPLWMRCLGWVHIRMRMLVLPLCLICATCAILINDVTCTMFLLDGLAITFTTFIDNLLAQFLLPVEQREEVGGAIAALLAEESATVGNAGSHRFLVWLFNRLYAAVLGLAVFAVNLAPESFMVAFGSQYAASGSLSCDNLLEAFAWCILSCVIVIAGIWPLLRERSFLSQRSKWRAFLNVAADAFCTMTFVWASLWLNPSNQAFFQLFLHSPLAVMLTWPLGVPVIIARLFAVPVPATMPWLAVRLGLLLAMVVLCVAVAWARGDGVGGDGENGVNFDLFPMEDL